MNYKEEKEQEERKADEGFRDWLKEHEPGYKKLAEMPVEPIKIFEVKCPGDKCSELVVFAIRPGGTISYPKLTDEGGGLFGVGGWCGLSLVGKKIKAHLAEMGVAMCSSCGSGFKPACKP